MNRLVGKICLVTGAANGIGLSIAEMFWNEGATVIAADLMSADDVEKDRFIRLKLDATDEKAVGLAARIHPDVSVLVNCVGYVAQGAILDCPLTVFDRSMAINVRSMAVTISSFLPSMLERGVGSIINIASVVSSVMAAPNRFAYATSKAAVVGLTMSVARDYIDRGIRCNAISPGTVDTPSLQERFAATGDIEKARQAFIARQPMGRLGSAAEVAAIAVLLASDESLFMTGTNTIIDGGMSL